MYPTSIQLPLDQHYMNLALKLALRGNGAVRANPMVGTVIVRDGKIVGQGYHRAFGMPHAEIEALRDAGELSNGATMYVTLEPCCHFGKTPPCTDAIIKTGIRRVVIGMPDPNPLVNLKGIEILRQHGISVTSDVQRDECEKLNKVFIKYIKRGLPFVTLKVAQSIDGRIATPDGHSQWITSKEARTEGHRLRRENDAVLIGSGTVLADNPKLTVRHVSGYSPRRIVIDNRLRIPLKSHLLSDEQADQTIVVTCSTERDKMTAIRNCGATVWELERGDDGRIPITTILKKIASEKMSAILVEGGAAIYTSFIKEKAVDHVVMFISPKIIGDGLNSIGNLDVLRVNNAVAFTDWHVSSIGPDLIVRGDITYNNKKTCLQD